jgi:hypothetical protein
MRPSNELSDAHIFCDVNDGTVHVAIVGIDAGKVVIWEFFSGRKDPENNWDKTEFPECMSSDMTGGASYYGGVLCINPIKNPSSALAQAFVVATFLHERQKK